MDARRAGLGETAPVEQGGRYFQPKGKSKHFNEVIRRHVCGQTAREIANALDITVMTVSNLINSCFGKAQIDNLQAANDYDALEVAKQIQEIVPRAVQLIAETISDEEASRGVRLKAAQDLLDRAGHGAVKKVDMRTTSLTINAEQLEEIKMRAKLIASNVIDA